MNNITPIDLHALKLRARSADFVTYLGKDALRLDGLALLPNLLLDEGSLSVEIAAEGACYPGIAFRAQDERNYELAYAQPHTSGLWDAIQYDPVFNDSNTWQLYHGEAYQKKAMVPIGEWFTLKVNFTGSRAQIQVGEQPPLVVERLAHATMPGLAGLWTYLPAYFRNFQIQEAAVLPPAKPAPAPARGVITAWELEGCGIVQCELDGFLNLNRYLSLEASPAVLSHEFEIAGQGQLALSFGFSDELILELDGEQLFQGENLWKDSREWAERGYVDLRSHTLNLSLAAGKHFLKARLAVKEYFGWGLVASLNLTSQG